MDLNSKARIMKLDVVREKDLYDFVSDRVSKYATKTLILK